MEGYKNLDKIPIGKIKGTFKVPKYQWGYRWGDSQVQTLLSDLWEKCKPGANAEEKYCLQPVVVKNCGENYYELIDGQQRFTTILILLNYIKREWKPRISVEFKLEYETRKATEEFMKDMNEAKADKNIDFYYIYHADLCIREWLASQFSSENDQAVAIDRLYGYIWDMVYVIWYEAADDEDSTALFTRLNIGKIELTNAELIKALLLRSYGNENDNRDKVERAFQWDAIEKELHGDDDELWGFLTTQSPEKYPTRIELLFDMMSKKSLQEKEKYFTFFWFDKQVKEGSVKKVWDDIQSRFLQIKEWYSDNEFYHKIGYLISSHTNTMKEIFDMAEDKRKSVFLNELDQHIAESINFKLKDDETYSDLSYDKNKREIANLLLLFNVQSIIQEGVYQRFPFGKYNSAEWTLEHIHAQNSQGLKTTEKQIEWIAKHLESVKAVSEEGQNEELIQEMDAIVSSKEITSRSSFDDLFNRVCQVLSEGTDTEYIHNISNMALLTRRDNAILNNSTFDVKRNDIIEMDKKGAFIPYCTKMVFLKYYTPSNENQIHFWGEKDRIRYIEAIEKVLTPYMDIINKTF